MEAERRSGEGATEIVRFTCNFLFMCSGYYKYEEGYTPEFAGRENFAGPIVHPQKWPEDLDYAGKRVVVIGSGATAVTLVPEMAKNAAHVTMLQRSPTYVVSRPAQDPVANKLRRNLPAKLAYHLIRWRNVLWGMYFFQLCQAQAGAGQATDPRRRADGARARLRHRHPFHAALQSLGSAAVPGARRRPVQRDQGKSAPPSSTSEIDTFTKNGIKLKDGSELEADIIVTATGLVLQVLGGMEVAVDGRAVDFARTLNYKGMMYSDVPNLASAFGYTNASWTLKCDLTCEYVCRLINYMDRHGYKKCMPHNVDPTITELPSLDFSSGYVQRSVAKMPKQGSKRPWRLYQNYALDIVTLRFGKVDDGVMQYS